MENSKENVARVVATLRDKGNYKELEKGYFRQVPELYGYLYELSDTENLEDYKIFLIVNLNPEFKYPKERVEVDNYYFIIINAEDFDTYVENISIVATLFMDVVDDILGKIEEKKNQELPYGYKLNDEGELEVDPIKAQEVRKIYKLYLEVRSMQKLADMLKTNFSHVRDVLRDERYLTTKPSIISKSLIKSVASISLRNQKNKVTRAELDKSKDNKVDLGKVELSKAELSKTENK